MLPAAFIKYTAMCECLAKIFEILRRTRRRRKRKIQVGEAKKAEDCPEFGI